MHIHRDIPRLTVKKKISYSGGTLYHNIRETAIQRRIRHPAVSLLTFQAVRPLTPRFYWLISKQKILKKSQKMLAKSIPFVL